MEMTSLRRITKAGLARYPSLFRVAQRLYHEGRFLLSRAYFALRHPAVKIVRYSEQEIERQRQLGYRSQFGQDHFIHQAFFAQARTGFFVDVGCNQPEYLSNSYYFERHAGWRGLAVDPIDRFRADWQRCRNALFISAALGAQEGQREFLEIENAEGWANMMSAFADKAREEDLSYGYRRYEVQVRPASSVFDEHNVGTIDLMSIDVEGAEIEVLSGLDFKRHAPQVILVENVANLVGSEVVRRFLNERGYRFHARIWTADDVFVKAR